MTSNALHRFVLRSTEWIHASDDEQLIASAMWALKDLYHVNGALFLLRGKSTTTAIHDPWDSQISHMYGIDPLLRGLSGDDGDIVTDLTNHWLHPNQLLLQQNVTPLNIEQVGIWKLSISPGRDGILFLARSTVHPDEEDICACMAQLSLLLTCAAGIRRGHIIEQKHNSLIDFNPDAIFEIDLQDRLVHANSAFERITGYSAVELHEKDARRSIVDGQYLPAGVEYYNHAQQGISSESYESQITRKDGQSVPITLKKIPIVVNGEIVGMYSVGKDISELKRMETALREAEEKYRFLVEGSLVGVYAIQDFKIVYANPKFCDVFGYAFDEVLYKDSRDFIHDDFKDQVTANIYDRLTGSTSKLAYQMKGIRKDQTVIEIEVHGAKSTFNGRAAVIGTLIDITERKKAEALLVKSEKLAVVGELAAGLAHEIRNPLTSLKGFVQLLTGKQEDFHYRSIMLSELDRINQIVSELLMVSKPQTHTLEEDDVGTVLAEVITLMHPQAIMKNVQIIEDRPDVMPKLNCNRNQLKQVFVNLIKNAIESMSNGGTIHIQLRVMGQTHMMIRIRDFGCGISKERLKKIGEPFYTTKEKGTGLGLMVCYRIIENHNGQLKFFSQVNKGTTALMLLPLHER